MDGRKYIDQELQPVIDLIPIATIDRDNLERVREETAQMREAAPPPERDITSRRKTIQCADRDIELYVYSPQQPGTASAALLWFHGGGYIMGDADDALAQLFAEAGNCVVVSVDYRLAPEHPFPAGPNDGYEAWLWMLAHADELCIDIEKIAIGGVSAGAGLAAGICLMIRDRQGPQPMWQFLLYPMLDNLHETPSGQIENHVVWNRETSFNAWEMYLQGAPGTAASPYAAAARAENLSGLPPAYITVGTEDLFRDENIEYAQRLMATGVATQLEVFPGIFHAAETLFPDSEASRRMRKSYLHALTSLMSQ